MVNDLDLIQVGVAAAPFPGEFVSGDRCGVVRDENGVLVALVDALGHGQAAADAAAIAMSTLETNVGKSLTTLVEICHEKLRRTRGVAMSLARFSAAGGLRWLSVGNVDGVLLSGDHSGAWHSQHMMLRGGVVGYRLPQLMPRDVAISTEDVLIMNTDGIKRNFVEAALDVRREPQALADLILQRYGKASDDALVLVTQYRGERP